MVLEWLVLPVLVFGVIAGSVVAIWTWINSGFQKSWPMLAFIVFWAVNARSAWKSIKDRQRQRTSRTIDVAKDLSEGMPLSEAIAALQRKYPNSLQPRHFTQKDTIVLVEIEIPEAIFVLQANNGILQRWWSK